MKKNLLLIGAIVLATTSAFAQKKAQARLDAHAIKAQVNTELSAFSAAPAKVAKGKEVVASPSVNKAPRRTMANFLWYQRPEGSFYVSGSSDGSYWSYLLMPPFTTVTYKNMSENKDLTTWSLVSTSETYPMDGNDDNDLELYLDKISNNYISSIYIPTLTQAKDTYRFGEDVYDYNGSEYVPLNPDVALINGDSIMSVTQVNLAAGYYYGFSNGTSFGNRTATFTGEDGEEINAVSDAIYEFYKKPLRPLYITDLWFRTVNFSGAPQMPEGTEMKVTVAKVDGEGNIGDVIAEMPFTLNDSLYCESFTDSQGVEHMAAAYSVSQKEVDAFGTEYDVPFVVDSEFVIIISGFEQEGVDFSLYMSTDLKDGVPTDCFLNDGLVTPTCRSYIRADNGERIGGLYYCQAITAEQSARYNEEDGDDYDWTRHYNAVIHIDCMQDVVAIYDDFRTMTAPVDGGNIYAVVEEDGELVAYNTVQYETTLPRLSTWAGYEGEENYQFEDLPDWLHIVAHIDDYYYDRAAEGQASSWATLTQIEADPLPEGEVGRKAVVRIVSERGAEDSFTVIQGVDPGTILDITDGKYYLQNWESEKYWGSGNNWGTRASLVDNPEYVTLLRQPDGTYFMETQVSNGGTSYYFGGDYMDGNPVPLTFTQVGDVDGIAIFTIADAEGKYFGYDGQTTILGKNLEPNENGNIYWAVAPESQMKDLLSKATVEDPMDATFLILDPNFGRNNRNYSAWIFEASNKNNAGDNTNYVVESYHSEFSMNQTLENIPNGVYAMTAQGFYRQDGEDNENLPVFFANKETKTFPVKTGAENSMNEASTSFTAGNYTIDPIFVEVKNGKLDLGAKLTGNANLWCLWDNFQLQYYGPGKLKDVKIAVLTAELKEMRDKVKELLEEPYIIDAAKDVLNAALKATSAVNTAKEENVMEAIKTLKEAIAEAERLSKANKLINFEDGIIADNSLDGWSCTTGNSFEINTWSVEGNEGNDPSGMVTPFIQSWVGAPGPLGEGQLVYTLENVPADTYSVTALIRVYSESGAEPAGATYFVNDAKADIAQFGSKFEYNNMKGVFGNYGLTTTVGEEGVLKFGVDVAAPTFNWVAIKNVKISKGVPTGIQNVNTEAAARQNVIYNLNGQKVNRAQKGLYIINGKKVVK
jgi:hypothetical protein